MGGSLEGKCQGKAAIAGTTRYPGIHSAGGGGEPDGCGEAGWPAAALGRMLRAVTAARGWLRRRLAAALRPRWCVAADGRLKWNAFY